MSFVTRDMLRGWAPNVVEANVLNEKRASASAKFGVFLSHSHKDEALVDNLAARLAKEDVDLYVDWKDNTMPEVTSGATAYLIKSKIRECGKMILLATNNAVKSRWVPWELGVGDSENGHNNVVVMPVADHGENWEGNEYIQIYPRLIVANDGDLGVFPPGSTSGTSLAYWLESKDGSLD